MLAEGHDLQRILSTVESLVNSGPPATSDETLGSVQTLRAFVERNEVSGIEGLKTSDIGKLHALREKFFGVFTANDPEAAVEMLNHLLNAVDIQPRLTAHNGQPSHLHYFPARADLYAHLAADGAMALAFMQATGRADRLRVCDGAGCSRVFVDLSRNGRRRYCDSRKCGNRMHASAYRERRRNGP